MQVSAACALRGSRLPNLATLCGDLKYHDTNFSTEGEPARQPDATNCFPGRAIGWASTVEWRPSEEPRLRQASSSSGLCPLQGHCHCHGDESAARLSSMVTQGDPQPTRRLCLRRWSLDDEWRTKPNQKVISDSDPSKSSSSAGLAAVTPSRAMGREVH